MKNKLAILLSLIMSILLLGCGEKSYGSLQEYYAKDENYNSVMSSMEDLFNEDDNTFSEIAFDVTGNTFTYIYTFTEEQPVEVADSIEDNLNALSDEEWQELRKSVVSDSGITDTITVVFSYLDPDGTELITYTAEISE